MNKQNHDFYVTQPWCLLANEQVWNYNTADPATSDQLLAMAEQLAKIARFNGATAGAPYSVAQHSLLVADLVPPDVAPYALLHDFHEALFGDLITPAQWVMQNTARTTADYKAIRRAVRSPREWADHVIFAGAGLPSQPTDAIRGAIKMADLQMLMAEVHHLFPASTGQYQLMTEMAEWEITLPRLKHPIRPLPWDKAADALKAEMRRILPVFNGGQMP